MRVFIIIHTTTPGGVQRVGIYEASFLKKFNSEAVLLSIIKPKLREWELLQRLKIRPVYLAKNEFLGRTLYTLLLNVVPISVDSTEPDIVIAHNIPGGQVSLNLRRYYKKHFPIVFYLHDPMIYPISGSFYDIVASRFPSVLLRIEEKLIQESDVVLVNSRRALVKLFKFHRTRSMFEGKVVVLYPTMNMPISEHKIKKSKDHYLLIVGRIDHEAFFNLYKIVEKIDIPLVIAGSYHPYNMNSRRIIQLFLNLKRKGKEIRFVFNPSDDELLKLYRSALLFVYPGHENFNMSALEAMSAGCPTLIADSSGVCEILPESLREYLCLPKDDIDAWIARILEIIQNDGSYRLGKRLWKITQKYNVHTHMSRLIEILKRIE